MSLSVHVLQVGYTFTVSLKIGSDPLESKRQIDDVVLRSIPGASVVSVAGGEVAYRLPFEETASFPAVFDELDRVKEDVSISTYGISITTLEEVFLKIGKEHRREIEGVDSDDSGSDVKFDDDADSIKLHQQSNTPVSVKPDSYVRMEREDAIGDAHARAAKRGYAKVGEVFPPPTFQLEQSEILIFFEHFFAILYRRWFWGIRDLMSVGCGG